MLQHKEHYRELLKIGVPIVIGQLGVVVVGFIDTLMVGWHSKTELAAAGFVNSLFALAIIVATGFAYGFTPLVGSLFGRGERERIGFTLYNSLWTNTLLAGAMVLIFTVLFFCLPYMGQPEQLLPYIRPYFLTILASLPFVIWFTTFKQLTDGITDTKVSMWILVSGNALNIVGNYLLIYGKLGCPELGLLGAGISTLFARVFMVGVYVAIFLSKRYAVYYAAFRRAYRDKVTMRRLTALGTPIALQMGMETASFTLSTVMVGWIGEDALATNQIMLTIANLTFMMYFGMGSAIAVRISNFYGQKRMSEVRQTATAGYQLILLLAIVAGIPLVLLRNVMGGWFTDDAQVSLMVAGLIVPFLLYQVGDGLQITYANALRGITDVSTLVRDAFIAFFVVSLPSAYVLGFVFQLGLFGVWLGYPLGLTCAGILYYRRFSRHFR